MTKRAERFDHAVRFAQHQYDRERIATETTSLAAVLGALEDLSNDQRRRVIAYASLKFGLGVRFE